MALLALLAFSIAACGGKGDENQHVGKAKEPQKPQQLTKSKGGAPGSLSEAGAVIELKDFDWAKTEGKVVFIEFWGTWCGPCIRTMPAIQKHYDHYKSNPDFMMMAINTGSRGDNVKKISQWRQVNKAYTFPVYLDSGREQSQKYKVTGIPRSVILDRQGEVAYSGHPMRIPADLLEKLLNS